MTTTLSLGQVETSVENILSAVLLTRCSRLCARSCALFIWVSIDAPWLSGIVLWLTHIVSLRTTSADAVRIQSCECLSVVAFLLVDQEIDLQGTARDCRECTRLQSSPWVDRCQIWTAVPGSMPFGRNDGSPIRSRQKGTVPVQSGIAVSAILEPMRTRGVQTNLAGGAPVRSLLQVSDALTQANSAIE